MGCLSPTPRCRLKSTKSNSVSLSATVRHRSTGASAGAGAWRDLADGVDVSHMASVNAGLFTGVTVGPYASLGL